MLNIEHVHECTKTFLLCFSSQYLFFKLHMHKKNIDINVQKKKHCALLEIRAYTNLKKK